MDARQQVGAGLVVAGVALVLIGAAGIITAPATPTTAVGSPSPAATAPAQTTTPTQIVLPTDAATAPTTVAPTIAPTAAPTQDTVGLVRAFFEQLGGAIRAGTHEAMLDRLAAPVIERYGLAACSENLATRDTVPEQAFEILEVSGPEPWDYVTDERTTLVPDALTVTARVTGPSPGGAITTEERELHVQLIDGAIFWFTDCGEPRA